tara:strand:- start:132 stop:377 length:246 start_codon:yes stop_codon:yes gene_type:complete
MKISDLYSYKHKRYDETIMQTKTVEHIIESLNLGLKNKNMKDVVEFLVETREKAKNMAIRRKANRLANRIDKLREKDGKFK